MIDVRKLLIPSFFIIVSLFDMITTIIGISDYGLIESNPRAFPLFYGFFTFLLWLLLDKFVFKDYRIFRFILFPLLCSILFLPTLNNILLIIYG